MAKLHNEPYPGEWGFSGNTSEYFTRTAAILNSIPRDKIIKFPIADGYALYYIKSERPLVLQHIPYGDAWQIPDAHLRGLRLSDVQEMIRREEALNSLFSAR